jgi:hypothetical protein
MKCCSDSGVATRVIADLGIAELAVGKQCIDFLQATERPRYSDLLPCGLDSHANPPAEPMCARENDFFELSMNRAMWYLSTHASRLRLRYSYHEAHPEWTMFYAESRTLVMHGCQSSVRSDSTRSARVHCANTPWANSIACFGRYSARARRPRASGSVQRPHPATGSTSLGFVPPWASPGRQTVRAPAEASRPQRRRRSLLAVHRNPRNYPR